MSNENPNPQIPKFQIQIEFNPQTGELKANHTCPDLIALMGMIEMGKKILMEKEMKRSVPNIVPGAFRLPGN